MRRRPDPRPAGRLHAIACRVPGAVAVLLVLCAAVTSAFSVQYWEGTVYDPTSADPNSGDECLIEFVAPRDTPQGRADVGDMRAAFEFALANSADMRMKVGEACMLHGRLITVVIFRDDPRVYGGETYGNGIVALDPGDLEAMPGEMLGAADDIQWLADHMYIWALAHEIDHNRDLPGESKHDDPAPAERRGGVTGPAVDDETEVFEDLGVEIARNCYTVRGPDGKIDIDFTVRGRAVTLNLTESVAARDAVHRLADPAEHTVGPSLVLLSPGEPCLPGSSPTCFPPIGADDIDHDGVPDGIDNCIDNPNPRQSDWDGDGKGSSCDDDDDGDGSSRSVEAATGSSDADPNATPEHWGCTAEPQTCSALVAVCTDGIDNDLDGFTDEVDPGCQVPLPDGDAFPGDTAPGQPYREYNRIDHGGVEEKQDALLAGATVRFDFDMDGTVDSVTQTSGIAVIRHGQASVDGGGIRSMPGALLDFQVNGSDPALGDFVLQASDGPDHSFSLTAKQAGSDFPATGTINLTLELDPDALGPLDSVTAGLQSSFIPFWQPYETIWNSFGPPMIFRDSASGNPVVRISSITLRFERDSDHDGAFNSADNCPDDANPGQENEDGDSFGDACDCKSMDSTAWDTPPDADVFFVDINSLIASPDGFPGSQLDVLDVVRSGSPDDFVNGATCLGTNLPPWATQVTDPGIPSSGGAYYYLGQLENGCPGSLGEGPTGTGSDGAAHVIRDCD